jgi:hypothetical protein
MYRISQATVSPLTSRNLVVPNRALQLLVLILDYRTCRTRCRQVDLYSLALPESGQHMQTKPNPLFPATACLHFCRTWLFSIATRRIRSKLSMSLISLISRFRESQSVPPRARICLYIQRLLRTRRRRNRTSTPTNRAKNFCSDKMIPFWCNLCYSEW